MIFTPHSHPSKVTSWNLRCRTSMFTLTKPFLCFFSTTINFLMYSQFFIQSTDKSLKGKESAVCSSSSTCISFAGDEWPCQTDLCVMVTWQCTSMSPCRFVGRKPPQAMTVNEKIKHQFFWGNLRCMMDHTHRGSLLHNNTFSRSALFFSKKSQLEKCLEVKLHAEQKVRVRTFYLQLVFLLFKIWWYYQGLIKVIKGKSNTVATLFQRSKHVWRQVTVSIDFKTERNHIPTGFYFIKFTFNKKKIAVIINAAHKPEAA